MGHKQDADLRTMGSSLLNFGSAVSKTKSAVWRMLELVSSSVEGNMISYNRSPIGVTNFDGLWIFASMMVGTRQGASLPDRSSMAGGNPRAGHTLATAISDLITQKQLS